MSAASVPNVSNRFTERKVQPMKYVSPAKKGLKWRKETYEPDGFL